MSDYQDDFIEGDATNVTPTPETDRVNSARQSNADSASQSKRPYIGTGDPNTDPYKLELQRRAFDYRVDGWSHGRIGRVLGINRCTVGEYIEREGERRWDAAHVPGAMHTATEASIAIKQRVVNRMLTHLNSGDVDKEVKAAAALLKAQEQIDVQRGISSPKAASASGGDGTTGGLAAVIGQLGPDTILALVTKFAEQRGKPVVR